MLIALSISYVLALGLGVRRGLSPRSYADFCKVVSTNRGFPFKIPFEIPWSTGYYTEAKVGSTSTGIPTPAGFTLDLV